MHHRVGPEVVWRVLPDEVLALGTTGDDVTSIRGSAVALWASLLDGATREALEADAVQAGCPVERAPAVVDELLDALTAGGLVTSTP